MFDGKEWLLLEEKNIIEVYYEKDNIVWERTQNGDKKRTPEERDTLFNNIINNVPISSC